MKKLLSRRISRLSSFDHSTLGDDENGHMEQHYETNSVYSNSHNLLPTTAQQQQQQLLPQQSHQQQQQQQQTQAPSKPLAPYALFFRDTMTAIKQQNPACTLEQITAIAHNMWESIDEKQKNVYDQRHELEKREYMRQVRDYQRYQQLGETGTATTTETATSYEQSSLLTEEETPAIAAVAAAAEPINSSGIPTSTTPPPSEQIQLLTEAAAVQKCTRDQCNKPAIINPDWEDEYCSNECVVIHCRNVFTEWARSLQNSPT
ncbi:TOX high mobility group box family member 4 isoform X2 [Drosophila grimshawi]|uniref:TOX high mobility group box family member 4 isoform X2 n=1 Tax=Drosophila grimshawi TaxID=7222 RepID=UPI000C8705D5|nr:TOX high mobility group box family member 4 isoform X2 [Drosophila grimshawi]